MNQAATQQSGFSLAGLQNPTFDSTMVFRLVLDAMSRPGKIVKIDKFCESPKDIYPSISAVLLTLADIETQIWVAPELLSDELKEFLAFHTGAKLTDQIAACDFALIDAQTSIETLKALPIGSADFPDRSATLIISVSQIDNEGQLCLKGPGIQDQTGLSVTPLPAELWQWFKTAQLNFPCGNDLIFASAEQLCAIPRTTQVED